MQIKHDHWRTLFAPFFKGELFVGFSGGADSTAALLLALQFRAESECRVTAVHFNHHLRGAESDKEARDAAEFAEQHNVEFRRFDLMVPRNTGSLEAAAREERLRIWQQLAGNRPDTAVVLGHHADDRAENFFLRLLRGSNASGLANLRSRNEVAGITFLRPLWAYSRSDIEEFLCDRQISTWAMDSSNAICDCRRNTLRQKLLPQFYTAFPEARTGLRASLDALAMDADFLEQCAKEKLTSGDPGNAEFWRNLPPALLVRALRFWQKQQTGEDTPFAGSSLQRFEEILREADTTIPRRIPLGNGRELVLQHGKLHWVREVPQDQLWLRDKGPCRWGNWLFSAKTAPDNSHESCEIEEFFDPDALPQELWITSIRPGECMIPFGSTHEVSVKKLRVDSHHTASELLPVLRDGAGNILWIPGVRRAAAAPVKNKSCRIRAEKI